MLTFLYRLWLYFGVVGMLSILLYLGALVACGLGFFRFPQERTKLVWLGLCLGILGFLTSLLNSAYVGTFVRDTSEQVAEAKERTAKIAAEEARGKKRFVEESVQDVALLEREKAAVKAKKEQEEAEKDGTAQAASEGGGGEDVAGNAAGSGTQESEAPDLSEVTPEYKKRGKQEIDESKWQGDEDVTASLEQTKAESQVDKRLLPSPDYDRANAWDRSNLFLARWSLAVVILLVLVDYARRFNRTFQAFLPLPLASRWLDAVSPKAHSAVIAGPARHHLAAYLRDFVARGESFLYFGPQDPIPEPLLCKLGTRQVRLNDRAQRVAAWVYDLPAANVYGDPRLPQVGAMRPFSRHVPDVLAVGALLPGAGGVLQRQPHLAEALSLLAFNLGRFGKHALRRLPLVVALELVMLVPFILFFRNSFYVNHYLLAMILLPIPLLVWNTPPFRAVLPKLRFSRRGEGPRDREFFMESAWFGRLCASFTDEHEASEMLYELRSFLKARRFVLARARRTVNVVWDFPELPERVDQEQLQSLCRQANFRFIRVCEQVPQDVDARYEDLAIS